MGRSCIYVALLRMSDEDTRERAIASGPGVREASGIFLLTPLWSSQGIGFQPFCPTSGIFLLTPLWSSQGVGLQPFCPTSGIFLLTPLWSSQGIRLQPLRTAGGLLALTSLGSPHAVGQQSLCTSTAFLSQSPLPDDVSMPTASVSAIADSATGLATVS